ANYVSEYDSKVDREMRGPHGREQAGGRVEAAIPFGRPDVSVPQPGEVSGAPPARPNGAPGRPGPLAMRDLERRAAHERVGAEATPGGDRDRAGTSSREVNVERAPKPEASGDSGTGAQRPTNGRQEAAVPGLPNGRPNLAVSPDVLQRAIGKGAG